MRLVLWRGRSREKYRRATPISRPRAWVRLARHPAGTRTEQHFDRWLQGGLRRYEVLDHTWPVPRYEDLLSEEPFTVTIGEARAVREGTALTLVAWGAMLRETGQAADLLMDEGIEAEVLDLRTLVPLDVPALIRSVKKTGRAVVVHEAPRTAGLGSCSAA